MLSEYTPAALDGRAARAKAAERILKAAEGAPQEIVDLLPIKVLEQHAASDTTWIRSMGSRIGIPYASGRYGDEHEEAAVLSILSGHWPRLSPVMTVEKVIQNEAEAIRKERAKRPRQ
jgi:hypothetical protein